MSLQSELIKISNKGFLKRISDDLFQGIKKVYNTDSAERRRWIWELIQNAKDTPNDFGSVSIQINLKRSSLEFSHNGNPFSIDNLVGIIQQVSTKSTNNSEDGTTGKFGTGFITTHMLSRVIHISGIVSFADIFKRFQFELDRDAETQEDLLSKVEDQIRQLYDLPNDELYIPQPLSSLKRDELSFDTKFIYPLSETSIKYAIQGIDDLKHTAHIALLLNNRIKQFIIQDEVKNQNYVISRENSKLVSEHIQEFVTKIDYGSSSSQLYLLCYRKSDNFEIVIPVRIEASSYEIEKLDELTPRVFKDFPLIGTESWGSNIILNSKLFQPTEPRNGLELHIEEGAPKIEQEINRNTIKEIYSALTELIEELAESPVLINNLHLLCESSLLSNSTIKHEDVHEWLRTEVQIPFRKQIVNLRLVLTNKGLKPISECKFPYFSKDLNASKEFYSICEPLLRNVIPVINCYDDWVSIMLGDSNTWGEDLIFRLDDLIKSIEMKQCKDEFKEFNSSEELLTYLNRLYLFLINNDKSDYFKYKIVPNQEGRFEQTSELHLDIGIPDELKELSKAFSFEYRSILADSGVECGEIKKYYRVEDISKDLNAKIGALLINIKTGTHHFNESILNSLITLSSIYFSQSNDSKSSKVIQLLQRFFPVINLNQPYNPNFKEFEFISSLKALTKYCLFKINSFLKLNNLTVYLSFKSDEQTIVWLDGLLRASQSHSELDGFLNHFAVFPNQEHEFCLKSQLSQDVENIEALILDTYTKLYPQDPIRKRLLIDGIGVYPDSKITFEDVAKKIDNAIRERHTETSNPQIKTIILDLVQWCKRFREKAAANFTWLEGNKAMLVLQTIESGDAQQDIFRIIQSEENFKQLAEIAESGDLDTISRISIMAKLQNIDLKRLENIVQMAGTIDIQIIEELASEKYEEELDIQFKTIIGENIEKAFVETFSSLNLNIKISRDPLGQDFTLVLPNGTAHRVEIKSVAQGSLKVLLSKLQGKTATKQPDNYSLCVLERPEKDLYPDVNVFIKSALFIMDIGHQLAERVAEGQRIEDTIVSGSSNNIILEFENSNYKISIDKAVWIKGKDIFEFAKIIST